MFLGIFWEYLILLVFRLFDCVFGAGRLVGREHHGQDGPRHGPVVAVGPEEELLEDLRRQVRKEPRVAAHVPAQSSEALRVAQSPEAALFFGARRARAGLAT